MNLTQEQIAAYTPVDWDTLLRSLTPESLKRLIVLARISGRVDMVDDLSDGFQEGIRAGVVFARLAEADAQFASSVGLSPLWGTGMTAEEAAQAPLPTADDVNMLLDRIHRENS